MTPKSPYKRQWVRCKQCGRVAYYDYIPYSFSNPVRTMPCGHEAALRFSEAVECITATEAEAAKEGR